MKRLVLVMLTGLFLAAPPNAAAQDRDDQILFVGQLLSVSMHRDDYSRRTRPNWRGEIVVSNSCGTLEATFRVVQSERRLPRRVIVARGMGEWCVQHIPFEMDTWLVILDRDSRDFVAAYPLFEGERERMFAFEEDDAETLARFSPRVRGLLEAEQLTAPVRYPFLIYGDRETFVEGASDLTLSDEGVMLTRGVPIDRVFPGFTLWAFYDR